MRSGRTETMQQNRRAFCDDTVFNAVNAMFVTPNADEIKYNNQHVNEVIMELTRRMREKDDLFANSYRKFLYVGSHSKRTKVGSFNEYDLDIVLKLPIDYKHVRFQSRQPGYIKIHSGLKRDRESILIKRLEKLLDDNMYLNQKEFRCWVEGILSKTVNDLPYKNGEYELKLKNGNTYKLKIVKSGPAFTICLTIPNNAVICIDFVPVLEFSVPLPKQKQKLELINIKTWLAVPKPILACIDLKQEMDLYWRLSFYEQERVLLANSTIKPVIRQLKKLRDVQNWKGIASYYIETLFLHELGKNENFGKGMPQTLLFFNMLNKLYTSCAKHEILDYWDKDLNLLKNITAAEIYNIGTSLRKIIHNIEKEIVQDPYVIAKYILNKNELELLKGSHTVINDSDQHVTETSDITQHSCNIS